MLADKAQKDTIIEKKSKDGISEICECVSFIFFFFKVIKYKDKKKRSLHTFIGQYPSGKIFMFFRVLPDSNIYKYKDKKKEAYTLL